MKKKIIKNESAISHPPKARSLQTSSGPAGRTLRSCLQPRVQRQPFPSTLSRSSADGGPTNRTRLPGGHTSLSSARRPARGQATRPRGVLGTQGPSGSRREERKRLLKESMRLGLQNKAAAPQRTLPGLPALRTQKPRSAPARRPYATGLAPEPSRIWLCALRRGCAAT